MSEQLLILLLRNECDRENPTLFSSRETMMEHVTEEMVKDDELEGMAKLLIPMTGR